MNRLQFIFFSVIMLCAACTAAEVAKVESAINAGLIIAGDTCTLVSEIDPSEPPQWVAVSCKVAGLAGPIVTTLPWSAWTQAASSYSKIDASLSDAGASQ